MRKSSTEGLRGGISKKDQVYVGLYVHKRSIYAAVRVNGQEGKTRSMSSNHEVVLNYLKKYRAGLQKVVYEAGPTGYGLARRLRKEGIPAEVIAPWKIRRAAQEWAKSDRLDCRKLAEDAQKGSLESVTVPSEEEEAHRQLVRLRDSVVKKKRRVKQQIRGFLLQYSLPEPKDLDHWNLKSIHELKEMKLSKPLKYALDSYIRELLFLQDELRKVNRELRELVKSPDYEKKAGILRSHPGVGEVTTVQMLMEVYQPQRFKNSKQVTAYVG